ncbi:hypothetical protein G6F22_018030 [Rhizopus arrhizus]|nr:hypothetical protein G6F22_018030 [Rhizopus arrhizus]KAG1225687.1 hypothetical protein G6F68_019874 [Rhizopus microsporus]
MADGQHDVVGLDMLATGQRHAGDLAVLSLQRFHFAGEPDFATQFGDGVAHDFHHAHQAERADVRLAHVQDFFRRAGQHEFLEHLFACPRRLRRIAHSIPGSARACATGPTYLWCVPAPPCRVPG